MTIYSNHFVGDDEVPRVMSQEKKRRDSRALIGAEDRSLIGSSCRVSQYTQSENALKQRLKDIDHSFHQTNRRISHETHELKQILHGLQRDLKVSRPVVDYYVPTQLELSEAPRWRRYTTSTFPTTEKLRVKGLDKVAGLKTAGDDGGKVEREENPSQGNLTKRPQRSNSLASIREAKELRDFKQEAEPLDQKFTKESRPIQKDNGDVKDYGEGPSDGKMPIHSQNVELKPRMSTGGSDHKNGKQTQLNCSGSSNGRILPDRPSAEQLLQTARRRSVAGAGAQANAFWGRFMTSESDAAEQTVSVPQPSRTRRVTVGHKPAMLGAPRQRTSLQEITSLSSPYQPKLRKSSLSYPQYYGNPSPRNMNSSIQGNNPRMSPLLEIADEDQYEGPRRRASVAYRTRSRRKHSTLPPLPEDSVAKRSTESTGVWTALSSCRYLRKEEKEITIDDIFRKD